MKIISSFSVNLGIYPVFIECLLRASKPQLEAGTQAEWSRACIWRARVLRVGPGVRDESCGSSVGPQKRSTWGSEVCLAPRGH